jgi:hypothetical protein
MAIVAGSAVSVAVTCCALAAGAGPAGAAATAAGGRAIPASGASPVWGAAEQVPGIAALDDNGSAILSAVSCAAKGACSAGGFYLDGITTYDEAFVVGEAGGVWGSAQDVPTVPMLNTGHDAQVMTVSCRAAGNCGAAGYYRDASGLQTFVVGEAGGTWDGATQLPGTGGIYAQPLSEACPAFARCTIGGFFADAHDNNQPFVDDQRPDHTWPAVLPVPGNPNAGMSAKVESLSCKSVGNCSAGGYYTDASGRRQAFVVNEKNGTWHSAKEVAAKLNKGGDADIDQVSCGSPGNCAAVGDYAPKPGQQQPFAVSEKNGTWGAAAALPGVAKLNTGAFGGLTSVSCASAGNCSAAGYYVLKNNDQQVFVVTEKNWTWGTAIEVPGFGAWNTGGDGVPAAVSCVSPGTCAVTGEYRTSTKDFEVWVASERAGGWGKTRTVPGLIVLNAHGFADVYGLSCATAGSCGIVGYYTDAAGREQPFVASGAIAVGTTTTEKLAVSKVTYGHEQSARVSVTVTAKHGPGIPGGAVTVTAGSVTVCVITLKAGTGSCTLAPKRLKPGRYALVARYRGQPEYSGSAAAKKILKVVK